MYTLLGVIGRAVGYGILGGLVGTPLGIFFDFLVGLIMGQGGIRSEGVIIGAALGAVTGVILSDPTEEWCEFLDYLFGPSQVQRPSAGAEAPPKAVQPAAASPPTTVPAMAVERATRDRKPVVLFLCTGNSARSQMAEAFLKKYAGDRLEVYSAGMVPKGIHPLTARVMTEIGLDISGQQSKGLRQFLGRLPVHYAIIVCRNVEPGCPTLWAGALNRLEWPFDDPAADGENDEARLHRFRAVRDQIEEQVKHWLAEAPLAC